MAEFRPARLQCEGRQIYVPAAPAGFARAGISVPNIHMPCFQTPLDSFLISRKFISHVYRILDRLAVQVVDLATDAVESPEDITPRLAHDPELV